MGVLSSGVGRGCGDFENHSCNVELLIINNCIFYSAAFLHIYTDAILHLLSVIK